MPKLSPITKLRRKLDAEHRSVAEREIIPVLQERVVFPADLLVLVHEHGLENIKIGDVWPKGSGRDGGKRGPKRGKRGPAGQPSKETVLWSIKAHKGGVALAVLAEPFPAVTKETIRNRLRELEEEGLVKVTGSRRAARYLLTAKGSKAVKGRRPKEAK